MPSQVPSFSSFELQQTIEPEASTSKHDKKRRRHRPEEEEAEDRRHRHRSAYDDRALDRQRSSGRSHRKRNDTDSDDERRREVDSRRGERRKRTSTKEELGREDRDERHRSRHRRESAEHDPNRKATEYRSRGAITADHNKASRATSPAQVPESQRLRSANSRGRYDSTYDTLPVKKGRDPESHVWSLSLIKAVMQDWNVGSYDVRGDGKASRYGGPEASHVPKYKRVGKGAILGLPLHLRIVATTNNGLEVGSSRRRSGQTHDAQVWHQTLRPARRRLTPSAGGPTLGGGQEDYVGLETVARRSLSSNARMADPFEVAVGDVASDEEHTSSSASDTDDEQTRDGVEQADLKARLRETDQRTRSHPADIRAWLALADLQQQVVGGGSYRQGQGSRERGSAARKTIAEVQLSVLDKAQRAHADNAASILLGFTRLQVAISGSLWDDVKVDSEFRRLLNSKWDRHTGDDLRRQAQAVWTQYLSWQPTSASATLTDVSDNYAEALRFIATFGPANAIEFCSSLQFRLCELLQRAGYSARAFAILQAQLELTLVPFSSGEEAKDKLERHWDSEEPRIGEEGAVLQAGEVSEKPVERARTASPSASRQGQRNRGSPLDQWVATQGELAHLRQRPARTDDPPKYSAGEGEVDPFSVVLFSDIRPFLISSLPVADRLLALRNLARYFGLRTYDERTDLYHVPDRPVLKHVASQEWSAHFWPSSLQRQREMRPRDDDVEMDTNQQPRLSDPWTCPLISATRPLNSLAFLRKQTSPPLATADVKWLTLMLQQLPTATDEEQGAISAFQLAIAAKTGDASILNDAVRKPCVDDDRADLARERIFALDESPLSLLPELQLGVVDAVEYHFGVGQPDVALTILEKAVSNGHRYVSGDETLPVTVAQKLKARRYYSNIAQDVDEEASPASLAALVSAAWYHYLVGPPEQRLAATLRLFDGVVDSDPSDRTHRLCEAHLRVVWYHLSQERPIYRPADVRRMLVQSVSLFPHDSTFLALLAAHESRFKIEGVVRRTLEDHVLQPLEQAADSRLLSLASVVEDQEGVGPFRLEQEAESSWLMAIYIELHLNREVVNSHLVRSLFERAVQQEVTKTSNVLWTLYLSFEVRTASKALADLQREKQQGRDRRDRHRNHDRNHDRRGGAKPQTPVVSLRTQQKLFNRAKAVFYRALSACPFDRDMYLQAYEYPFRTAFSAEDLRQLYSVMDDERELRVYGRIEGLLQMMEKAERGGKEAAEGDETDDEEEGSDGDRVQA